MWVRSQWMTLRQQLLLLTLVSSQQVAFGQLILPADTDSLTGMQTSTQTLAAETRPPPMNGGLRVETVQAGTGALVKKCPTTLTRQAV